MFTNITDSAVANNKGSSGQLVHYLEKENRILSDKEPEPWFNGSDRNIEAFDVRRALDGNIAKLSKADAKFYLVNISPSQKELKFLKETYGRSRMREQLKVYAEKVMDEYARNFKRDGVASAKDLLWFGKIERNRCYGHTDMEVKDGTRKRGEKKEGSQMHVQVVVSRKDITNRIKLSPMNNSRGKNPEHSKKLGQFDRVAFKQSAELIFDGLFGYDRKLGETMAFANVRKNGDIAQREQMDVLEVGVKGTGGPHGLANDLAREISNGVFSSTAELVQGMGDGISGFIKMMMERSERQSETVNPVELAEKRRRKQQQRDQGIGI